MTIFDHVNLAIQSSILQFDAPTIQVENNNNNMFGVGEAIEESSHTIITWEMSLFWSLWIPTSTSANSIVWCQIHKDSFLNVSFLAK